MRAIEDLVDILACLYGVALSLANVSGFAESNWITWLVTMGFGLWMIRNTRLKVRRD